ncbi:hypothetical protein [Amycolatopsis sp. EV170708-02-1]|nr:hypothetical protein [Amycolatopsis sp. EV170708-02-1]
MTGGGGDTAGFAGLLPFPGCWTGTVGAIATSGFSRITVGSSSE